MCQRIFPVAASKAQKLFAKNVFWADSCSRLVGLGAVVEREEAAEGSVVLAVETGFGVADVVEVAGGGVGSRWRIFRGPRFSSVAAGDIGSGFGIF